MEIYAQDTDRKLKKEEASFDFVVAGGGLAGVTAAISAAREGLTVALIQDRPVLGGNASSEVRLWALGATSHMGNNNRFAREGGIMGEILEENLFRNKEGNPVIFDMILLDLVNRENNITLFLNTAVFGIDKVDSDQGKTTIKSISAFNSINETQYVFNGKMFSDCTGDGIVGFLAGGSHRVGAEETEEFDERMAPDDSFGKKLGHSIYFYTKHVEEPIDFTPPEFALKNIEEIPRYKRLSSNLNGCDLWWLEWGGRMDTIRDSEAIKWELWKIVWGVWDHIKNSGKFPEAAKMTLEWVGVIPGKRESRRFIGDYMIQQKDIIEQRDHYDAISFGGWSIDLHPADGVYSKHDGCRQFHSKGVYTIPFRTMYSKDIDNLFLGGRTLSATHVAFGSTRVMCTTGQNGQVIGQAAAICMQLGNRPHELAADGKIGFLQQVLMSKGFYIPRFPSTTHRKGRIEASSTLAFDGYVANLGYRTLKERSAIMLPLKAGEKLPAISFDIAALSDSKFETKLLISDKAFNHTPEIIVGQNKIDVTNGKSEVTVNFDFIADQDRYVFVVLGENLDVEVASTDVEIPGVVGVFNTLNAKVAKGTRQIYGGDWGVDEFDFWLPKRRPNKVLPAFKLATLLKAFDANYAIDGYMRPSDHTHAWVPAFEDNKPTITLSLDEPACVSQLTLVFDNDFDHAMETSQWGHKEKVAPSCSKDFNVLVDGKVVHSVRGNHHSSVILPLKDCYDVSAITLEILSTHGGLPGLFAFHAF